MQLCLFVKPNGTQGKHLHKHTSHAHYIARPEDACVVCAAVMFYVLSPTFLTELRDEDSLSAPDLSVFYRITGSKIK